VVLILYAISFVCLLAVIAAAAAVVYHIRSSQRSERAQAPPEPSFSEHFNAAAKYGSIRSPRLVPHQTVKGITAKKDWNIPSQTVEIHPSTEPTVVSGLRKSPQSERADWAHFNNDFGDLTDPYTSQPRAGSGVRAAASKRC